MNNETYLDFCFVRKTQGNFSKEINDLFSALFTGLYLNWFLEEKIEQGADIVIAQVKGMSKWRSEEETIQFLEDQRAPFVQKTIKKLQFCPDHTHLRIYFDEVNFFAIPLDATVTESVNEWTACDQHSGLNYTIKRENE